MVKTLRFQCREFGFHPWLGNMPRAMKKIIFEKKFLLKIFLKKKISFKEKINAVRN